MPQNKKEIDLFVNRYIQEVTSEGVNTLLEYVKMKRVEKLLAELNKSKKIKERVLQLAETRGDKSFHYEEAQITICELGTKYDYSNCNDSYYNQLLVRLKALNQLVADREKMLKALPLEGVTQLDETTGEIMTLYPPSKTSTTGIKITID